MLILQVIEMKRKPMPRMPSFDHAGGFYDMSPYVVTHYFY